MKKYYKLFFVFVMMFLLTGCMKANINMTINKDKSMTLGVIYAISDELAKESTDSTDFKEESDNLKKNGFTVTGYKKDGFTGIEANKTFKNIDEISSDKDTNFDLNALMEKNKDAKNNGFKVKKGLFKNHYYATMKVDTSGTTGGTNGRQFREADESDSDESDLDQFGDLDYSSMMSGMDLSFVVNVPYKAINSNATSTENDGKTLKWDLTKVKEDLTFEFALYNMRNIFIAGGVALVIVLLIVTSIITKGKSSKPVAANVTNTVQNTVNQNNESVTPVNNQPTDNPSPVTNEQPVVNNVSEAPVNNPNDDPFANAAVQGTDNNPKPVESPTESSDALNDLYNN